MPVRLTTRDERLQLLPSPGGRWTGVLVFDENPTDVPRGGNVMAWLHRPYELNKVGLTDINLNPISEAPQGYKFELAPLPPAFSAGGVSFRTRARTLAVNATGTGAMSPQQHAPVWADFVPAQAGSLVPGGKAAHFMQMPDLNSPVEAETEKRLLRMRFTGTAVAGATLYTAVAETRISGAAWASNHVGLAPGSVVVHLPAPPAGRVLRDDGRGRLVGAYGDGVVDYVTGAWEIWFNAAETGAITVDYEHSCSYFPIDAHIEWDWMLV